MELFPADNSPRALSLVRLSGEIARSVAVIGRVSVEGEVVDPRTRRGTTFLTLRDRAAQIGVICPASRARRCRTVHGERVSVTGTVQYDANRGRTSLLAEEVVPVGAGAIAAAIADTRKRLSADGLLDRPRRLLPRLPAAVGVICGGNAAVRADIESVVEARFPGYPVVFAEVAVSGPGAVDAMVGALRRLDERGEVEVVILARGGGDATELMPFSDEELCRAVAGCRTPVVSAVGHHGDNPLCDEVADLRCATPSLAAEAVVPERAGLRAELDQLLSGVGAGASALLDSSLARLVAADPGDALTGRVAGAVARVEAAGLDLARAEITGRLAALEQRLAGLEWAGPLPRRVAAGEEGLRAAGRTLDALDPERVLSRGYAVVRTPAGDVVRDPDQVTAGDALDLSVARGSIAAVVVGAEAAPGAGR
jgi:exodeoxyribonuclease VII large subunit